MGSYYEELFCVKKDDKYGYIDINNEWIIEPIYSYATDFSEGLACVKNDDYRYGYIDREGKVIIPFEYESGESFSEGLAYVRTEEDRSGFIDTIGKLVFETPYGIALPFEYGVSVVYGLTDFSLKGAINREGKSIVPTEYEMVYVYKNYIEATLSDDTRVYFDKEGNILQNINDLDEDDNDGYDDHTPFLRVLKEGDEYKLISREKILLSEYKYIKKLDKKRYFVSKSGSKALVIDENLNPIYKCKLSDIFYN